MFHLRNISTGREAALFFVLGGQTRGIFESDSSVAMRSRLWKYQRN